MEDKNTEIRFIACAGRKTELYETNPLVINDDKLARHVVRVYQPYLSSGARHPRGARRGPGRGWEGAQKRKKKKRKKGEKSKKKRKEKEGKEKRKVKKEKRK